MAKRLQYIFVTLGIIAVDAITKWLVTQRFAINDSLVVFPSFFQIVHVRNTGAAFGIGANSGSAAVPMFLNFGAIAVFIFVAIYAYRSPVTDRLLQVGLHLILGGAVGNLIDRFRFGSVVDFLDFYATMRGHVYHWPAFNVADSAICIGIALLFLDMRSRPATEPAT
jgi:signal peptidase II